MAILRSSRGQCGSGKGAIRDEGLAQGVEHDRGHNEHEQDEVDDCERGRPRRFPEDTAVEVASARDLTVEDGTRMTRKRPQNLSRVDIPEARREVGGRQG